MRALAAALLAAIATVTGCVPHPVGPARTYGKYEGKAVTTAESALSAVETVRLAAETAERDHAFGPYLGELISESEEAATGVQGTFASIQPPSGAADQLRGELSDILTDVVDHLAEVRVVARRGRLGDLAKAAEELEDDSKKLNDFIEAHKK